MVEVLSNMIRKIIKEELANVITEVSDLKKEVKMLQCDLKKHANITQNLLKMNSLINQTKVETEMTSTRELLTSSIPSHRTVKTSEIKDYEELPDFHLWSNVLNNIEKLISKPSFDTWLKGTNAKQIDEETIVVLIENEFQSTWLGERYQTLIKNALDEVSDITFSIEFRY
jgi:chromosomal replication initiation ATPase DnaA